jgi:hypothetical protein
MKATELRRSIEPTVARWEHATALLHSLEPYLSERSKLPRGKRSAKPRKNGISYGFDAAGRLVLERNNVHEMFYLWSPRRIDRHAFERSDGRPLPGVQYALAGDRVVRTLRKQRGGGTNAELYEYDKLGRVVRVRYQGRSRRDGYDQLEYDASGKLARIVNHHRGKTFVVWKRRGPARRNAITRRP